MRTSWFPVLALLAIAGCYERDDVCAGGDCRGDDDGIPEIVLDDDPGAPDADTDGDGLANGVDTDDDDDGIQDDADVDVDGDGLLEEAPSTDTIEASWAVAHAFCEMQWSCCMDGGLRGGGSEDVDVCRALQFPGFLPELEQAAEAGGARLDLELWEAEYSSQPPSLAVFSFENFEIGCPRVTTKGYVRRPVLLEEIVLPYFHGTRSMGEPCFTRWDCAADARCDGLVTGSGEPGVCGLRPHEGGPCGAVEPFCSPGQTCTVLEDGTVCERPRGENEFCRVFELGGRPTDNCDPDSWCDDAIETAACRPMLREGDVCLEDRQCRAYDCDEADAVCGPLPVEDEEARQEALRAWCPDMFPTARPWDDES